MVISVSIIIPCYNEEASIQGCLLSLLNQRFHDYEIIVVNDGSTDRTGEVLEGFKKEKRLRVITKRNEGRPRAINTALKKAKGEIIAVTDADCKIPKNWVKRIIETFAADPSLEALGGVYEPKEETLLSLAGNLFERIFMDSGLIPNNLPGANSAYRKKTLLLVGGYPERKWGADSMLDLRLREHGKRIRLDPSLTVKTGYPTTLKAALKRKFFWGGGLARILDKVGFRLAFLIRPVYFLFLFAALLFLGFSLLSGRLLPVALTVFILLLTPVLLWELLSLHWIIKHKRYRYLKALPVLLYLPLLQEFSYVLGFIYTLIGGTQQNAWRQDKRHHPRA